MKEHIDQTIKLSPEILNHVREWKDKPGNLIMILHKVQEEYGYVPREAALKLTELLDIPLAKVYGVLTFYHLFKLKKPGKYPIQVCMGTACYLKGGEDIIRELENLLGIGVNQISEDGLFSIEAVRCIGCCGLAPVMTIGGEVFGKVKREQLAEILARFKE
ncbi:MAG: NAD(P)H-dependent oxidoreductase subunit E [Spirochaetes bacterium]|nr:NAD(P)H-dependent oxidoreductase subunit E [Spirochaetota bacterium]